MSSSSDKALTAGDYIGHHLVHLQNKKQVGLIDFGVVNLDTIFWSIILGVIGLFVMWRVAKSIHSGVPGRMQAAVEMLLEMVDSQAKGIVKNAESRKVVGPLALTVFVWIFLMNSMDFLPVDLFHSIFAVTGLDHSIHNFRVVPTADLSATLGMSCGSVPAAWRSAPSVPCIDRLSSFRPVTTTGSSCGGRPSV